MKNGNLTWLDILRLGLVQTALGSIVVLSTSVLNRVLAVELALPTMAAGFLVALHYVVQLTRPRWGYSSDVGGRRTVWIIGGIGVLGIGAVLAAVAVALYAVQQTAATLLAITAFILIGGGVAASGTSLLALLTVYTEAARRPAAAATVWLMMIAGFVVTTITVGRFLDPYSPARLVTIFAIVSALALIVTIVAVAGVEKKLKARCSPVQASPPEAARQRFKAAFAEIWGEQTARQFTIFVFVSMLAFSLQDLILEPFAGLVFAMTPGETTRLSGTQHAGVFAGMLLTGALGSLLIRKYPRCMQVFCISGCLLSASALLLLAWSATIGPGWPLDNTVAFLGFGNGMFAVAAIGSMMGLAGVGRANREGTRMGIWGAAQAIAFGLGGFL
ncbi:MAG: BCD family MFS transporter, partial [Alphaproteobacteria bacterium]|nr:BCD family MFS transporter [Alphaproteobacteria bacterium]